MDVETAKTNNGCNGCMGCRRCRCFAWTLCGISFVVQFLVLGFYKGFGPIYVALLREFKEGDSITSWVGAISFSIAFMLTPVTFEICKRLGFRVTMLIGSVLYGLGLLISSFAGNVLTLYGTFGLMFGVGQSLCYSASILVLPEYFKKNWALAHGIALSGNGLGALFIAPAFEFILSTYGFRMGFQIISTASLVLLVGGLFYKRPNQPADADDEKLNEKEEITSEEKETKDEGIEILEPPEIPLRKNKPLIIFLAGTSLMHFGYYIPYVHLVRMAIDIGVPDAKAALLPGYMSLAQSIGKIVLGKLATFPRADKIVMYQVALLANCLATTLCPIITNYTGLIIYAIVFGMADGCTSANNMLVVGDLVGRKLLSKGYSMFLLTSAASFLIGPPTAGFLYDTFGSYSLAFFLAGGTAALAACVMFLVPIAKRKQDEELRKLMVSPSTSDKESSDGAPLIRKKSVPERSGSKNDSGISVNSTEEPGISQQDRTTLKPTDPGKQERPQSAILTVELKKGPAFARVQSTLARSRENLRNSQNLLYHSNFFPVHLSEQEVDDLLGKESHV